MTQHTAISAPPNPFDQGYLESEQLSGLGFKSVGTDVRIARNATIIGLHNITIGDNIRIDGATVIAAYSGSLELGDYIHIANGCYLGCAGGIRLADFCNLSQGVRIYSGTDDFSGKALTNPTVPRKFLNVKLAPVSLEKHVIVGSGSVILPGVTIGEGASVGALSLVTKSLDGWGVFAGIPVKRLRARTRDLLALEQQLRKEAGG